jgi:hypothetical protein
MSNTASTIRGRQITNEEKRRRRKTVQQHACEINVANVEN